ncbi:MAG TPA: type II secretion system protein GspD, partial [Burkholderiales bacterium]|nr:type II secretion system protein GspD [Burkholderiales bacterium]
VLARFLETVGKGNVLSTPSIMTLDNEEARILVGSNIPLVSGSYAQTGAAATVSPFQTFDRRDIGTQLRVKPQISQGGTVRLQIYQETSSVDPATVNDPKGVTTNKRTIESTVVIDDNDILVLGGLVQDNYGSNIEKVPLLGDIPLLGNLFRYHSRARIKTNLMVFLQPRIVRDAATSRDVTASRYDFIMGEQLRTQENAYLLRGEAPPPVLPPLPPEAVVPQSGRPVTPPTVEWPAELNALPPAAATPPAQK